jgi:hypothetical protein
MQAVTTIGLELVRTTESRWEINLKIRVASLLETCLNRLLLWSISSPLNEASQIEIATDSMSHCCCIIRARAGANAQYGHRGRVG